MPRTATGRPNGRPRKEINLKTVEDLASLACTQPDIARFCKVALCTLTSREGFQEAYTHGQELGKVSLRRAQMASALAGNSRMLVWMGQQLLGQSSVTKSEITLPPPAEDLSKLTDADLAQYEQLLAKTRVEPSGSGEGGESTP